MNESFASMQEDGCAAPLSPFPAQTPLAMAYVPFQDSIEMYDPEEGLDRGTIFPCLDKPFTGKRGVFK